MSSIRTDNLADLFNHILEDALKRETVFFTQDSIYGKHIHGNYLVCMVGYEVIDLIKQLKNFIPYEDYAEFVEPKPKHNKTELGTYGNFRIYFDGSISTHFTVFGADRCCDDNNCPLDRVAIDKQAQNKKANA